VGIDGQWIIEPVDNHRLIPRNKRVETKRRSFGNAARAHSRCHKRRGPNEKKENRHFLPQKMMVGRPVNEKQEIFLSDDPSTEFGWVDRPVPKARPESLSHLPVHHGAAEQPPAHCPTANTARNTRTARDTGGSVSTSAAFGKRQGCQRKPKKGRGEERNGRSL
jgi:hypothetical protein